MREQELIDTLERLLPGGDRANVLRWLGDDAAIVRARGYAVTSLDTMVDGVHFRTADLTPEEIGHRALAAAVSDLAAMGAQAGEAYFGLSVPPGLGAEYLEALVGGVASLARACGLTVAGGDVTASPVLMLTFTVVGWADDPAALVRRDGARPGDLLGVTGRLGGGGGGLMVLDGVLADPGGLRERYARPMPRLAAGRALAASGATAMADLSDGLASDVAHLAQESAVSIEVDLAALPLAPGVAEVAAALGRPAADWTATVGDDYELCFTASPAAREAIERTVSEHVEVTWIGRVSDGAGTVRFAGAEAPLTGFEHAL